MKNRCYKIFSMQATLLKKYLWKLFFFYISNNILPFQNVKLIDPSRQNFSKFKNSKLKNRSNS